MSAVIRRGCWKAWSSNRALLLAAAGRVTWPAGLAGPGGHGSSLTSDDQSYGIPRKWVRGVKKQARMSIDALPQGLISAEPLPPLEENEGPAYPTVIQQVRNNMRKFDQCIVLTRVGSFYELYFEHAEQYAPLLNLRCSRKKTNAGPVAMAGFPVYQLDRFMKILVQDLKKHVAISEEFANDVSQKVSSGGLMFDRRVVRIITPGTLIDENFLDPYNGNYLLSVHVEEDGLVGLAWVDISSGDFYTQQTSFENLSSMIARIGPREIIVDQTHKAMEESQLLDILKDTGQDISFHASMTNAISVADWLPMLEEAPEETVSQNLTDTEFAAGSLLLEYVRQQLQGLKIRLQPPIRRSDDDFMSIDKNSLRGLELKATMRDGHEQGSLLHSVRRTVTKSGSRLLAQRLTSPSLSLAVINERLDLVSGMLQDQDLRENLVDLLRLTFDTLRLLQRFSFGRGDADDLLGLARTIELTQHIASILREHVKTRMGPQGSTAGEESFRLAECLQRLIERFDLGSPSKLATRIFEAIDEEGVSQQHRREEEEITQIAVKVADVLSTEAPEEELKGRTKKAKEAAKTKAAKEEEVEDTDIWIMRRSASTILNALHTELDRLKSDKQELAVRLREKLRAQSLTLRWTPGLGHICHLKGKDAKEGLSRLKDARPVSSSKSTRSFYLSEWTDLGTRIDKAKLRIEAEEQKVFGVLRTQVISNLVQLRRNATVLDELDVACSFATLAHERNLVRPILNTGTSHNIIGGRHPMVDVGLHTQGRNFTPNNCHVGDRERILLITGPNMAGKSTYLRQNALISILAQTGSFVPADYAEIGLVDKIFSRVGSADNLFQDQSTFMVEMLETAAILKQATPRSFVIMDEVGRGTTPEDGIAVGYACLHHLHNVNQCRALFATHFHALADMTAGFERMGYYCTDVVEEADGAFSYMHKMKRGVNRRSHALKVARLAGLPEEAIQVAEGVLRGMGALPESVKMEKQQMTA